MNVVHALKARALGLSAAYAPPEVQPAVEALVASDAAFVSVAALFLLVNVALGLRVRAKNGRVSLFLPSYVFDLGAFTSFVSNWASGLLFYVQPAVLQQEGGCEWNENKPELAPEALAKAGGEDLAAVKRDILAGSTRSFAERDVVRLFDSLPAADPAKHLLNRGFHARAIRTPGSLLGIAEGTLLTVMASLRIGWGKRVSSPYELEPVVFNLFERIYFPLPFWGNASLATATFRGVSTACVSYNWLPWNDYVRVLQDSNEGPIVLLGVMTSKAKSAGWFIITEADVPL